MYSSPGSAYGTAELEAGVCELINPTAKPPSAPASTPKSTNTGNHSTQCLCVLREIVGDNMALPFRPKPGHAACPDQQPKCDNEVAPAVLFLRCWRAI